MDSNMWATDPDPDWSATVIGGDRGHVAQESWSEAERAVCRRRIRHVLSAAVCDCLIDDMGADNDWRGAIRNSKASKVVNRTASSDSTAWRRGPVLVCDSGLGAFQADYDVAEKRLSSIRFFSSFDGRVD